MRTQEFSPETKQKARRTTRTTEFKGPKKCTKELGILKNKAEFKFDVGRSMLHHKIQIN
jgi:hypothetical protein